MKLAIYQIDAFTDHVFGGNPACVIPLEDWLPDDLLLKIAAENAVAETAFFVQSKDQIHLRWFTPDIEMDLCGHATLATAYVLRVHLNHPHNEIRFKTLSGNLSVINEGDSFQLDFPSRVADYTALPAEISDALSIQPKEVLKARDYVLLYDSEEDVRSIKIDRHIFDQINLGNGGVVVTAKGKNVDFVSRFFTPQATILEDPVTGSSHCTLIPYWKNRLMKSSMTAAQLSKRTGILYCEDRDDRVLISGKAKTYMVGSVWIE